MKYVSIIAALVLMAPFTTAAAQGPEQCSSIKNANDRLACFDRQFPRQNSTRTAPRSEAVEPPTPAPHSAPADVSAPAAPAAPAAPPEPRSRGVLDWQEAFELTAVVSSVRYRDKQKMIFLLDNGQVWMQDSPRYVPIKKGQTVTVKSGTVGGYIMRNQGKTSTRVQRIK